jgi:hypothetical protein
VTRKQIEEYAEGVDKRFKRLDDFYREMDRKYDRLVKYFDLVEENIAETTVLRPRPRSPEKKDANR